MTPLHGDADLYVSRKDEFPDKNRYEKKSQRIGSLVDHVDFARENNESSLAGTYYISVYGYSYSTFSLLVTVKRDKLSKAEKA